MEKIQATTSLGSCIQRKEKVLKKARCEAISTKVAECKSDIKSLYNLVNNITGGVKENPLPKCKNDMFGKIPLQTIS